MPVPRSLGASWGERHTSRDLLGAKAAHPMAARRSGREGDRAGAAEIGRIGAAAREVAASGLADEGGHRAGNDAEPVAAPRATRDWDAGEKPLGIGMPRGAVELLGGTRLD